MPQADRYRPAEGRRGRFFTELGPGLISGAADDDPSSIGSYSVVGAQFGTSILWTAFITWPLIAAIQLMCARVGLVTGRGLARVLLDQLLAGSIALVLSGRGAVSLDGKCVLPRMREHNPPRRRH